MSLAKCQPMTAPTCHHTPTASDAVCGQTLIEVGDLMLCIECDAETIAQIRTWAF